MRKDISTLLPPLSAILIILLASSPMLFFNPILQPAQAQTNLRFSTPIPANATDSTGQEYALTFDAQGEKFLRASTLVTNGTFQITNRGSGQEVDSGTIWRVQSCCLSNLSNGDKIMIFTSQTTITTSCSTSTSNYVGNIYNLDFYGPIECSNQGGGNTTSSMTGPITAQDRDSDGDGIPDSSDRCTHNSNPKCFKEGTSETTTTPDQQQPSSSSSSSSSGNQTR